MKRIIVTVATVLIILTGLAVGQPIATPEIVIPAVDEVSKWLQPENLKILFGILTTIITIATPFLLKGWHALINLAKQKSKNELVIQVLDRVDAVMPAIVKSVYEEFVKGAKAKSKDGDLTEAEAKEALQMAFVKAKAILGPSGVALLTKNGVDLQTYVEGLAGVHVEHAKQIFSKEDEKN